jgi:hypothetical protein
MIQMRNHLRLEMAGGYRGLPRFCHPSIPSRDYGESQTIMRPAYPPVPAATALGSGGWARLRGTEARKFPEVQDVGAVTVCRKPR